MQNNQTISYLKFFHGFIKFGKGAAFLLIIITIIGSILHPNQIDIPIQYEISDVGTINFNNSEDNQVWLFKGEGKLKYKGEGALQFTSMSAFNILFSICAILASYFIYFLLDKIVETTINKKPFSRENVDRMKRLGYILIAVGILSTINKIVGLIFLDINFSSEVIKQESFGIQLFQYTLQLLFNRGTMLGLFALLVSQILSYGIELKEETELTI